MSKPTRNVFVDAVRLFLAYGVAAIHLAPNTPAAESVGQSFLLFAVPFFLTAGLYFFIGKTLGGPAVPTVRAMHFERLWLPYLAWTAIYVALHLGKDLLTHRRLDLNVLATVFYGGAAVHLYFLPLLLVFQCWALAAAWLWREPARRGAWAGALLLASGLFAYVGMARGYLGFEHVFVRGALYVGGAFLLWSWRERTAVRTVNSLLAAGVAIGLLAAVWRGTVPTGVHYAFGPLAGYAAASLALAGWVRMTAGGWGAFLLGCSYGIYLAHFALVEAFEFAAARGGWQIKPYDVPEKLLVALAVCAGCVVFIALVRRNGALRAALLGEPRLEVGKAAR